MMCILIDLVPTHLSCTAIKWACCRF